jgi:hypothetical protein
MSSDKNRTASSFHKGRDAPARGRDSYITPEIGRIRVTSPRRGRLDAYCKGNGSRGTSVLCFDDGGRYGVTLGVQRGFDLGRHEGWAFVDPQQAVVFQFVVTAFSAPPPALAAIDTAHEHVAVPPSAIKEHSLVHGQWVAFYSRVVGVNQRGQVKREAADVLPLDRKHPLRLARLITGGRLVLPDHQEIVDQFLEAVAAMGGGAATDYDPIDAALSRLGSDPTVPPTLQLGARVERSRLATLRTEGSRPPPAACEAIVRAGPVPSVSVKPIRRGRHVVDVEKVNLMLE